MKENVFGFEVSVNDIVAMHILDSRAYLPNVLFHSLLGHLSIGLKVLIQIFAEARLKNQVNLSLVNKKVVQLDDIGMI